MTSGFSLEEAKSRMIAFLFPDESSFYRRMGIEIFENYKEAEQVFKSASKVAKVKYESLLMYEHEPFYWDDTDKKIAVLVSSVSLYSVFSATSGIVPSVLWGRNTGYLAALVCEEVISLKNAIQFIRGKQPLPYHIKKLPELTVYGDGKQKCTTKKEVVEKIEASLMEKTELQQMIDYVQARKVEALIEIGPNNLLYRQLEEQTQEFFCTYLDTEEDCNCVLENILYKKFFNRFHAIKRMLGYVVSTKLNGGDDEAAQEVFHIYGDLKNIIDKHNRMEQQGESVQISDEEYEECYQLMMENFEVKNTPIKEINQRLKMLEQETLLPMGRRKEGGVQGE